MKPINQKNPNQKLRTRIPSQQAIAAFFGQKSGKGVSSLKNETALSDTKLNRLAKRQKVEYSSSDRVSPSSSSSLSSDSKENIVINLEQSLQKDRNLDISTDAIDEACLAAFADEIEEDFLINDSKNHWSSDEESDVIRGSISSIDWGSNTFEISLKDYLLPKNATLKISIQGCWSEVPMNIGDIFNVILDRKSRLSNELMPVVDDHSNMLVLHPDTLISATTLVGALNCTRQTVLNEKFPFPSVSLDAPITNKAMFIGKVVHELFQWAIKVKSNGSTPSETTVKRQLESIISQADFLIDIYSMNMGKDLSDVKKEIVSLYVPSILRFNTAQVGPISAVRDIEENVWSPRFGIKGKVDASVSLLSKNSKVLVPLELKTGQPSKSREHFGQVMLYNLVLADRYGVESVPNFGLLSYLKNANKDTQCIRVVRAPGAIQGLLQTRNELASYLAQSWTVDGSTLPIPVVNEKICSWCAQSVNCALNYLSDPRKEQLKVSSLVAALAASFNDLDFNFWLKWSQILNAEYNRQHSGVPEWLNKFWTMNLEEMEESGFTVGHLRLLKCQSIDNGPDHRLVFVRHHSFALPISISESSTSPLSELFSSVDSYRPKVLISSSMPGDRKFIGLCFASIDKIGRFSDGKSIQYEIMSDKDLKALYPHISEYRIDIVSSSFSNSFSYKMGISNLSTMFQDVPDLVRLRSLVTGQRLPQRRRNLRKEDLSTLKKLVALKKLTRLQKEVVLRVLVAEDYLLVRGYPGTGKSTTLAAMIQCLLMFGYSVLLAAYTNTAVDSILMKLIKISSSFDESSILRLGPLDRINPNIHRFCERKRLENVKSIEELEDFYKTPKIVAGTCHALHNHVMFSRRKFSICVVDEASQTLLPISLGPILCSEKFVLVGDPNQLSPLIINAVDQCSGEHLSLLERLLSICRINERSAKDAICDLTEQFRMNSEILRIPNTLYYDNRLICSEGVTNSTISSFSNRSLPSKCLQKISSSTLEDSVVFVNCSEFKIKEDSKVPKTSNFNEATLTCRLVEFFSRVGEIDCEEIGVISPFTDQVRLISKMLEDCRLNKVEVNTIDQFQGREKAVILMSLVKTSDVASSTLTESGILTNSKRLNVALTRARSKLVMIGSKAYLKSTFKPLRDVIDLLRPDQFVDFTLSDFNYLTNSVL